MLTVFCAPARYIQGRQATRVLAEEMRKLGLSAPALILSSPSPRKRLEAVWTETFRTADFAFELLEFAGECSLAEIARCKDNALRTGARCIVGVGGGKALDTARAVASELGLPVVCCPTLLLLL